MENKRARSQPGKEERLNEWNCYRQEKDISATQSFSHPCVFPPLPLHLCLLWLKGGVWGQSALVLLNGWQMTEKLEAFRSWQVVVRARFPPLFFCFKCFLSVGFQSNCLCNTISATCAYKCKLIHQESYARRGGFCVCSHRRRIWFCVFRLAATGGGRRAVCSQRRLPLH